MMIAMASVFARNEDCPVREIGDGLVIMAPAGDVTHSLEDIGAFIWRQLDGALDLDAVLDAIEREYDVERDVAAADLQIFVSELLAADIILQVR
jgi:hypothetical protein